MAAWLIRGGRDGGFEQRFIDEKRIYLTWDQIENLDLHEMQSVKDIRTMLSQANPSWPTGKAVNHATQIFYFIKKMAIGDIVVMPRKGKSVVVIGKLKGDYQFDPKGRPLHQHWRSVEWISEDTPRDGFDADLRTTFSAVTTIFPIRVENAERRILGQAGRSGESKSDEETDEVTHPPMIDLEQSARDVIARAIPRKFKGHGLEGLVEAILKAQGYYTYHSPEGADKGVDLLAAPGSLGFGHPRVCVQVKSTNAPVDHPTLHQLLGTMRSVEAEQGLLVSWGGFKSSVDRDRAAKFFSVRLWDKDDLIDRLLENYDKLPADMRAELPLKRIWTLTTTDDEE